MIVDLAAYRDGKRLPEPVDVARTVSEPTDTDDFVWIGLRDPSPEEFEKVARQLDLHPLAVEDAIHAHQRPKIEHYGDRLFAVLKPARYVDSQEVIELGELHVFMGPRFVLTLRYGESVTLTSVRKSLEEEPERLAQGPLSVLHAIADHVVDNYAVVLGGLENDIDEIEEQVFGVPDVHHAERIFKLKREVLDFRRAVEPLRDAMEQLTARVTRVSAEKGAYFRDVHDHVMRVSDHLSGLDKLLDSALSANVASVGMRQNADMRKISAWVAIVAVPTMIAGIYGMNFEHMPELDAKWGYPAVVGTMLLLCALLYRKFKARGWL